MVPLRCARRSHTIESSSSRRWRNQCQTILSFGETCCQLTFGHRGQSVCARERGQHLTLDRCTNRDNNTLVRGAHRLNKRIINWHVRRAEVHAVIDEMIASCGECVCLGHGLVSSLSFHGDDAKSPLHKSQRQTTSTKHNKREQVAIKKSVIRIHRVPMPLSDLQTDICLR